MNPITWLVNPPTPPSYAPPRTQRSGSKLYVRRNSGEYVEQRQHQHEFDVAVLSIMAQVDEPIDASELAESLPRGIMTTSGRPNQTTEVLDALRRLKRAGDVWRDGKGWGLV